MKELVVLWPGLVFFRAMVMNPKNLPDNCWGSVPVSNNHPALVQKHINSKPSLHLCQTHMLFSSVISRFQ
jgi:hypothetical protein